MAGHRGGDVGRVTRVLAERPLGVVRGGAASALLICSSVTRTASPRPASAAVKTLAGM